MTVDSVATTGSSMYTAAPTRTPKQEFDSDMFMSLLVTQLKNQDPSSPLDTNEMIGQTTQLASMEQLTTMTSLSKDSYALQQRIAAATVIGANVSYAGADGVPISGIATAVSFSGNEAVVTVGDKTVPFASLTTIAQPSAAASATD
ncbi:MAG: flagellar hook capping protein [Naasia sp.]|jgi:flagellar basal-body rod modification protein FlgD|uniref:flagellar hook assembly protein FlgD n=1 Tax=Naasia sp. TaxID=2546198 RepID=UPI0026036B6E|nr:flagellar hook capping FlgD N-terminal domain-containing protein [Naasia sp.]MCU1570974.1 flagellar hook capping protein [Naasia sp.]